MWIFCDIGTLSTLNLILMNFHYRKLFFFVDIVKVHRVNYVRNFHYIDEKKIISYNEAFQAISTISTCYLPFEVVSY